MELEPTVQVINEYTINEPISVNNISAPTITFWGTLLWTLVLMLAANTLVGIAFGIYYGVTHPTATDPQTVSLWFAQTDILLLITLLSAPLTLLFLRKATYEQNSNRQLAYLGVCSTRPKSIVNWVIVTTIAWLMLTGIAVLLNIADEPFMLQLHHDIAQTSVAMLVLVTVCFIAPVTEELVFRGWLFTRIANSKLGAITALLITSLLFMSLHVPQYNFPALVMVFVLGLLLGIIRYKSNNTSYCIIAHITFNSLSMLTLFLFY
jgi:membrane protease YdiL (CAAX protease family)